MRFYCFLLLAILPIAVSAQANYYDEPANAPITNTYVPIPSEMFMFMQRMASDPEIRKKMEQQKLLEKRQRALQEQKFSEERERILEKAADTRMFEKYIQLGNECLKKKQIDNFLNFAHEALRCGHYNSTLYHNIGVANAILGKKRISKRWLKLASEHGQVEASKALQFIKKKQELSYEWFIY